MTYTLSDFDYDLPDRLIAQTPAEPRDAARLLLVPPEGILQTQLHVYDLTALLQPGDLLVVNDTRVLPARLNGWRVKSTPQGDGRMEVEVLLHRCLGDPLHWRAFARPAKKLKPGHVVHFGDGLSATIEGREGEEVLLRFKADPAHFTALLEQVGQMPLPPYISRPDGENEADKDRYQTIYARHDGAVAAPTAGLHFTPALQKALADKGIGFTHVTLHVGAGTFQPVRVEDIATHVMHSEWGRISPQAVADIEAAKARGGRIICVGTTSLRLVESAARSGKLEPWEGETDIFITPGFDFKVADGLMTNFHLPQSTLLMLVAAFVGYERMHQIYKTAIAEDFRFYSYGDSSLLWRPKQP